MNIPNFKAFAEALLKASTELKRYQVAYVKSSGKRNDLHEATYTVDAKDTSW